VITAVDTNVLLDVFGADPAFGPRSKEALRTCLAAGQLVACEIVWAEVTGCFPNPQAASDAMHRLNVAFSPLEKEAALAGGQAWKAYRSRGGARQRVIADFLVGAHALIHAERLLTRDRGFYRPAFSHLKVFDPSTSP